MIVLDTHAIVWWVSEPDRLPAKVRRLVGTVIKDGEKLRASSISIREIAMLAERKRLTFTMPADVWISHVQRLPFLEFVPVDNGIALRSTRLDGFPHRDPAYQMIVATALGLGATLVTADSRLRAYRPLRSVWD